MSAWSVSNRFKMYNSLMQNAGHITEQPAPRVKEVEYCNGSKWNNQSLW